MFKRILMVCTGNICRSPMAEVVLADRLKRRGLDVVVESAGIGALVGYPADAMAIELMEHHRLDLTGHRARQLTGDLLRSFELILVMESAQQRAIEAKYPSARGRVHRIGRVGAFDVPDPYKRGRLAFEEALRLIERGSDEIENLFWSK